MDKTTNDFLSIIQCTILVHCVHWQHKGWILLWCSPWKHNVMVTEVSTDSHSKCIYKTLVGHLLHFLTAAIAFKYFWYDGKMPIIDWLLKQTEFCFVWRHYNKIQQLSCISVSAQWVFSVVGLLNHTFCHHGCHRDFTDFKHQSLFIDHREFYCMCEKGFIKPFEAPEGVKVVWPPDLCASF